jgi:hypothetical protein
MRGKLRNSIRLQSKTDLQLGDINRAWDTIRENNKMFAKESIGHCEVKHHKSWFDEEC